VVRAGIFSAQGSRGASMTGGRFKKD